MFSIEECIVIGDGWNDNKLFAYTNNGIAISSLYDPSSSQKLQEIAKHTIQELPELKEIL